MDAVGRVDQVEQIHDRLLVFNLGHDSDIGIAGAEHFAKLLNVLAFPDEGQGDKVHPQRDTQLDVLTVLLGNRRHTDFHVGKIDVTTGTQFPFSKHFAAHPAVQLLQYAETNDPVVHEDGIAFVDVPDEVRVIDIDGLLFLAVRAFDRELEDIAWFQFQRDRQVARANGRSLRIHHDRAGDAHLFRSGTDALKDVAGPLMRGVAHVQAGHVHARPNHLLQHLGRFDAGANGARDLGVSHTCRCRQTS